MNARDNLTDPFEMSTPLHERERSKREDFTQMVRNIEKERACEL